MTIPIVRHIFSIVVLLARLYEDTYEITILNMNTHFIFLVHGFMGNSEELSYIEHAIQEAISKTKIQDATTDTVDDVDVEIITHRVTCNNKQTFDGIEAGGKRVAKEILSFVSDYHIKHNKCNKCNDAKEEFQASISLLGYSLGGMYARYAISELPLLDDDQASKNNGIVLHPFRFVTAATPHLGMASHAYWTIPRCIEYLLGHGFGRTGQDLFRLNRHNKKNSNDNAKTTIEPHDLVYKMANEDRYLKTLSKFQYRISYINAFASDFQVPTRTAGMLSRYSNSPHELMTNSKYSNWNTDTVGFDVYAFETKPNNKPPREVVLSSGTKSRKNDEALTMALKLDSLGWTKVFVDSREGMTGSPSVRCICRHPRKDLMNDAIAKRKKKKENDDGDDNSIIFESRELCNLLRTSEHWHLAPTGHFVLVAHSKTKRGAKKSAKGRPLVDQAALELVEDMRRCT